MGTYAELYFRYKPAFAALGDYRLISASHSTRRGVVCGATPDGECALLLLEVEASAKELPVLPEVWIIPRADYLSKTEDCEPFEAAAEMNEYRSHVFVASLRQAILHARSLDNVVQKAFVNKMIAPVHATHATVPDYIVQSNAPMIVFYESQTRALAAVGHPVWQTCMIVKHNVRELPALLLDAIPDHSKRKDLLLLQRIVREAATLLVQYKPSLIPAAQVDDDDDDNSDAQGDEVDDQQPTSTTAAESVDGINTVEEETTVTYDADEPPPPPVARPAKMMKKRALESN